MAKKKSVSSRHEKLRRPKNANMKKARSIKPQASAAVDPLDREAMALAMRADEDIDLSDIPEVDFSRPDTVRGNFYRPIKKPISLRVDADVLAFFQSSGEGYQTRMNHALRLFMLKALQAVEKKRITP